MMMGLIGGTKPAVSSGFTPTGLGAALIGWYQASVSGSNTTAFNTGTTPATNGQTVTTWHDSSGNNQDIAQPTSGKRPVWNSAGFNSNACMTFAAANLTGLVGPSLPVSGLTTFSIFMYGTWNTGTVSYGRVFSTTVAGQADGVSTTSYIPIIRQGSAAVVEGFLGGTGDIASETLAWNGGHHVIGSVRNGTSVKTFVDGANTSPATISNFTWGTISWSVGCGLDSSSLNDGNCFDGQVTEVVIANTDLSSQAAAINTYFVNRWGS